MMGKLTHHCTGSSNIKSIAFREEEHVLEVTFTTGKTYEYYGVSKDNYLNFCNAPSKGGYFAVAIKNGGYKYKKIG